MQMQQLQDNPTLFALAEAMKLLLEYHAITERVMSRYPATCYLRKDDRERLIELNQGIKRVIDALPAK